MAAVAQEQLPILTELSFVSGKDENVSALPSEFLGGCAPRLRQIILEGIPFPTLPTFLSSATDLVNLTLKRIPHSGYISPEAMVASLALSTRLVVLHIEFQSSTSRPDRSDTGRRVATPSQVVLPDLTFFIFRGAGKYLEDLVAQIEAPRLKFINITYLPVNQLTSSEHELPRFDGHVTRSRVLEQSSVHVYFHGSEASVHFQQTENDQAVVLLDILRALRRIRTQESRWQVSDLAGLLGWCSTILSNVGDLSIYVSNLQPNPMDNIEWLDVLRQFTAVETLLVPAPLAGYIVDALKDVTAEMVSDIWPALRLLCLEDQPLRRVEGFIRARQLSAHPVTVVSDRCVFRDLLRQTP